jgi:hypothetical protein
MYQKCIVLTSALWYNELRCRVSSLQYINTDGTWARYQPTSPNIAKYDGNTERINTRPKTYSNTEIRTCHCFHHAPIYTASTSYKRLMRLLRNCAATDLYKTKPFR